MKNNKGFMLVEVIITSTVIITSLMGLYVTFNKIYNGYNVRGSYFDIDGVYAIRGMMHQLFDSGGINDALKNVTDEQANIIIGGGSCNGSLGTEDREYCEKLGTLYNIHNLIIIRHKKSSIDILNTSVSNQTFKDYLEYVKNYYTFDSDDTLDNSGSFTDEYSYLWLIEYKNASSDSSYEYSSLEVR